MRNHFSVPVRCSTCVKSFASDSPSNVLWGTNWGTVLANSAKNSHCNPNVSEFCAMTYLLDLLGDDAEQLWLRGVGIHYRDLDYKAIDYETFNVSYRVSIIILEYHFSDID